MRVFKLTDSEMKTYDGFQWELNKTFKTSGDGELCGPGFLHSYEHPLLAILHNPIHGYFDLNTARLFEAEADGKIKKDGQMKMGSSELTLIKEIEIPKITLEQRVAYAILCAKEVCKDEDWNFWADNWLSGKDRSEKTAKAARWAASREAASAAWVACWAAESAWTTEAARAAWAAEAAGWAAKAASATWAAEAARTKIDLIQIAWRCFKI